MKLLLLNWQDPENPQAGGAEVHLREVFGRLARFGHEVTWLASGWPGAAPLAEIDGMRVHRVGRRYTFGPAAIRYYQRYLADEGYEIVIEALNKVPLFTPLWCRTPVVLLVHHLFGSTAFQEASLPIAALTWLLERPLARVYRNILVETISQSTAEDLAQRGLDPEQLEVIYPGVDLDFFSPAASPIRAITPTFLYLGRLQRYKRVDLILGAFARLSREIPTARLLIAGRGDQEKALQRLAVELGIATRVDFLGYVSEEDKRALLRTAWANVFVSPKEGWGITNLEAGACGTPTVASDSPGLRESVVNGCTGLLVPHGDAEALSLAMRRIACDPVLMEELGTGAREFAANFTWERTARATEAHLLEALRKAS